MEWKEKLIETSLVGILALVGSWFVKVFKKRIWPSIYMLSDVKDIATLRQRISEYDAFIEIHRTPIYYTDEIGQVTYVNTAYVELTGFTNAEDAHGLGYMRAVSDSDEKDIVKLNENYHKKPSNLSGTVTMVNIINGTEYFCRYRNHVIRNKETGKFIKGIGILEVLSVNKKS